MNFNELKKYILDNDKIPVILEQLGMHSIDGSNNKYYSCGFYDGDNPSSTIIYRDESLTVNAYTRNIKRDRNKSSNIFDLIMFVNKCEFRTAISWCNVILGLDSSNSNFNYSSLKNSMRKKDKINKFDNIENQIIYYNFDILNTYSNQIHISLIQNDGLIDKNILNKYMIKFDDRTDRIVFPHLKYDDCTKIAGVVGRTVIKAYKELNIKKYMSMLETRYDKGYNLYGLSLNIDNIKKYGCVCVFEAEKSVMKLDMYGLPIGVAVGCHDISDFQRKLLISLGVEICICFDKDVDEEHIKKMCLSMNRYRNVSYTKDIENLLNEKDSPVDKGRKVWNILFEKRIKFI